MRPNEPRTGEKPGPDELCLVRPGFLLSVLGRQATCRIATQPFPQYTRGLSHADALKLLRDIDAIATRLNFSPAIGPAMQHDTDDTAPVDLLIDLLSEPSRINATLITAAEDGIHWKSVAQAART